MPEPSSDQTIAAVVLDWDGCLASVVPPAYSVDPSLSRVTVGYDVDGRPCPTEVALRPGITKVLEALSARYRLLLWTFSMPSYIHACLREARLSHFFPGQAVLTREQMADWRTRQKDLFLLCKPFGLRYDRILIIDDANHRFGRLNPIHCVDIPQWDLSADDTALAQLPRLVESQLAILSRHPLEELLRRREKALRDAQG